MSIIVIRRPELILIAAVAFLVAGVVVRSLIAPPPAPLPYQSFGLAPAPVELGTAETIMKLQDRLRLDPEDTAAYALLAGCRREKEIFR